MSDPTDLTIFYIVEPPDYQVMACTLLASIRKHFPANVKAVGYCPEHRYDDLMPEVHQAHEMMGSEVRTFKTDGMFDPAYPHGNKILATLEKRDSDYSMFVDSDVLFLRDNDPRNIVKPGHVSCSMAASMVWAKDKEALWGQIYGALDMDIPPERYTLMRRKAQGPVIPYFSSGLVAFPEKDEGKGRFADVWYDTARKIDTVETLENRRPYLDQMSLPGAIRRAGLDWNILPEEQHYILGGKLMRGKPLPENHDIYTIHYRNNKHLENAGEMMRSRRYLKQQIGVRFLGRLSKKNDSES